MINVGDDGDIAKLFYHGMILTDGYLLDTRGKTSGDYIGNSPIVRRFYAIFMRNILKQT